VRLSNWTELAKTGAFGETAIVRFGGFREDLNDSHVNEKVNETTRSRGVT
jgi:hypothetical protein